MSGYKVDITGLDTNELKVLKSAETRALIARLQAGEDVKDAIVMGNLKLILSALKGYRGQNAPLDDLFQVGVIGLIKAIDNFDLNQAVMFSTYAVPMIKGEIKRYMRDHSSLLKVSRQVKDRAYLCYRVKEELTATLSRHPTVEEIAEAAGLTPAAVKEAFDSNVPVMSFTDPISTIDGDELELIDVVRDQTDLNDKITTRLTLQKGLRELKESERRIIDRRYFQGETQMEIAAELGISQAQVSRLEKDALKELRKYF